MIDRKTDIIVVGAGNAAFAAAMAAREQGCDVIMLERAPYDERGGNSRYTAGAMRVAFTGVEDLAVIMDLTEEEKSDVDFGIYSTDQYFDDMARMTQYRADPDLVETLVYKSHETLVWMREKGIRFSPSYGRQAFKVDGKFKFWGGLAVEVVGGGPGLVDDWTVAAKKNDIEILYGTRATDLIEIDGVVQGVRVRSDGKIGTISANAVILAAGGFESNAEWRTRYMGPGWDLAKVRGTRFNMGDGIRMALDVGAIPYGNWSGGHAVGWDRNAPDYGDLDVGDNFQKHSYPLGIMVNATGRRFVDEGADFRNYTYAKYGRVVLEQPGQFAWQVFDSKVSSLLRDEYRIRQVTKVTADTIEELAFKLDDVDATAFIDEIETYNKSVMAEVAFDPAVKDGRGTEGLTIPKSNWANRLDTPPYEAYAITCGITFTFGGVRIDGNGQILDTDLKPIPGLYAAGEMVGGLFYFNYPGGTGLTSGAVFGRIAGNSAGSATVSPT
jgi:tricarballylate dehydrogenase